MSFKLDNFGSDSSNAKSTLGGVRYYRYYNKNSDTITTAGYFPAELGLDVGDRIAVIPASKTEADEFYVVTSIANRKVVVTKTETTIASLEQFEEMPEASAENLGKIVQYVGETDTYTNGYIYRCASTTEGDVTTYSWEQTNVQPSPQDILQNTATGTNSLTVAGTATSKTYATNIGLSSNVTNNRGTAVGYSSTVSGTRGTALGFTSSAIGADSVALGSFAQASGAYSIQLGSSGSTTTNSEDNTFKVANGNGNFMLMNANGNIPAERLAALTGLTDGNYKLRLTISDGVATLSFVAE